MKTVANLMFLLICGFGVSAYGANPYSDCGIGAALFPNTPALAVTTNVTWDAGTTAVISATASEDTCNGGAVKTAMLIHDKLESLETEVMTSSQGEVVTALMDVMTCRTDPNILPGVRSDMLVLLSASDYSSKSRVEKAEGVFHLLMENEQVKKNCSLTS